MGTVLRWGLLLSGALSIGGCSASEPGARDGGRDGGGEASADASSGERCAAGVDSDMDGLPNDEECALGADPFRSDTDMDGVPDGTEARYPRICVATDHARQRRPPVTCTRDDECMPGEQCRGLDPAVGDTDMDGVPDGMEDQGLDGRVDTARGETDPRLWDTDGDGMRDGAGLEICRPEGLATVTRVPLPMASIQVGHDPVWGTARAVPGTMGRSAVVLDDAAAGVAGAVFSLPSMGDVRAEAARVEAAVTGALGAGTTAVLVGRTLTTHEMNPAITSTYRVARMASASALRDATVMPLVGATAPAGSPVGASGEFLVDVTTVRRTMGAAVNHTDVVLAVAPRADYDNATRPTSIRVNDLVNTTGVAEVDRTLGFSCQIFRAERTAMVDFLWTVDVSPSMGPYQQQVGATAQRFFTDLRAAGVDFRVVVLQAQSSTFDFARPGVSWVSATDPMGALGLAYRVTVEPFMRMTADRLAPYPNTGMYTTQLNEEPIAAAVIAHEQLRAGAMMGAPPERRLRDGAQAVAFFVADETGANDDNRYFARDTARWGATYPERLANAVSYFRTHNIQTFGLVNASGAGMCDPTRPADMRRCVIVQNGGAYMVIGSATDADVAAAMARIVAAVAGTSSPFRLDRSPITSTIKVRVRGVDVPRSRSDGFDYDPASRSIVFFGNTHRPRVGDQVVVSYRVWEGSLG
jgi:hypothetical protein